MEHHEENRETRRPGWCRNGGRHHFLSEADQLRMRIALQNMRMACDSTYLLDQKTDHGVKADELVELLAEVFEDPDAKVVVFSQWVRMHELVVRRLERRKWGHVFFHGGVPGPERKELVHRFKEDPDCRLFLATDAGGVGLNLQNASVVVNLDQPWNPAVLEQRIGRVHRLGQRRPVRVVHFIAQGTIEEGMLGLLKFKKSRCSPACWTRARTRSSWAARGSSGSWSRSRRPPARSRRRCRSSPTGRPPDSPRAPAAARLWKTPSGARSRPPPPQAPASPRDSGWNDVLAAGMSLLEKLGKTLRE